jgi:DNA-binding helix-hairpin-helix protein with protein kinase domain
MSTAIRESTLKAGDTVTCNTTRLRLGAMVAQGGEGRIFKIDGQPGKLAKIYMRMPDEAQRTKLQRMMKMQKASLANISAWPTDLLYVGNEVVGFVMPEIAGGRPIHTLITPADRLRLSPGASFATLVLVASNLARAMTTFHQTGVLIGDLNGSNVIVMQDNSVRIIDCDSCQIGPEKAFRCPVGMEEFLPPELQGKKLGKVKRTRNHDAFPLAVMIYELLCMGRHPFGGTADMGLGHAIKKRKHMLRGFPTANPLRVVGLPLRSFLPAPIVKMFRRAFGVSRWRSRPTALEWMNALDDLHGSLVRCDYNPTHVYPRTSLLCPWCTLELRGRPSFFGKPPGSKSRPWSPTWNDVMTQRVRYAYEYFRDPAKPGIGA